MAATRLLALLALVATPALAAPQVETIAAPVGVETLDEVRGGLRLPDGTEIAISVAIETRVNGALVLSSGLSTGTAGVTVNNPTGGTLRIDPSATGQAVVLTTPDLELRHVLGAATGSIVANTANDRIIDTMTMVNVELSDPGILLAPALFRIDAIVTDATTRR